MAAGSAPFRFGERWKRYRGHTHGLPLPTMVGDITVGRVALAHFVRLDAALGAELSQAHPPPVPPSPMPIQFAERLGFWIIALLRAARVPCATQALILAGTSQGEKQGHFQIAFGLERAEALGAVLRWLAPFAETVFRERVPPGKARAAVAAHMQQLRPYRALGVNRYHLAVNAIEAGHPYRALDASLQVIGTGRYRRLFHSSSTEATSSIGMGIARDKARTAALLGAFGMPMPRQAPAPDAKAAAAAAEAMGYPVVIKPADQDGGLGVAAGLADAAAVGAAYAEAARHSKRVMVEEHVPGQTHRFTVCAGEVIRLVRRRPGGVVGNGRDTVAELLSLQLRERGTARGTRSHSETAVSLDAEALQLLADSGMTPASVPERDEFVRLRRRDNRSQGGTNEELEISDSHCDNLALALDAAAILKLDIAGVDLISTDISRSWRETGAKICEVNSVPQIGGNTSSVYSRMLARLFHDGSRIPVRLQIAPAETCADAGHLARICQAPTDGAASAAGVCLGGRMIGAACESGFSAAHALLLMPGIARAVIVMSPEELARTGLPLDRVDRAEVLAFAKFPPKEQHMIPQLWPLLDLPGQAPAGEAP